MGIDEISNIESANVTLPMNNTATKELFGLPIQQETFEIILIGALGLSLIFNILFILKRRK